MDKPAPTTEQLKEQWNAFAPEFARVLTRQTDVSAFQMLTQLQLHKEDVRSVVEVGCGAGGGTQLLTSLMRPGAKVVALDLTPAFLDIGTSSLAL
jgi:trans-aconitate methyltransferase